MAKNHISRDQSQAKLHELTLGDEARRLNDEARRLSLAIYMRGTHVLLALLVVLVWGQFFYMIYRFGI